MSARNIQVVRSNLEVPPRAMLQWGVDDWEQFAGDGRLMWSPIRTADKKAVELARQGNIYEWHQSWAQNPSVRYAGRALENAKGVLAMPSVVRSIGALARIQAEAGSSLPLVAHPNEQDLGNQRSRRTVDYSMLSEKRSFPAVNYQITAEVAARWREQSRTELTPSNLNLAAFIIAEQVAHGFNKTIADTHHIIAKRSGHEFADPVRLAAELAERDALAEVHFGIQPNFGGNAEHLQTVLNGDIRTTPQGEILSAIVDAWPSDQTLHVVTEVPALAYEEIGRDYREAHDVLDAQIIAWLPRKTIGLR